MNEENIKLINEMYDNLYGTDIGERTEQLEEQLIDTAKAAYTFHMMDNMADSREEENLLNRLALTFGDIIQYCNIIGFSPDHLAERATKLLKSNHKIK